ncbi:MAG: HAD-IIIA family hydrolase [Zoogloeaceae bacterium]|jgi:phosphoglycolate phosphatase|nr:HAD-IIIA family hydrolase [Zoogloeaceae bacterium]
MSNFDLIVFDWDGTLMDSATAIVEAIQASCRDLGLPVPSTARARHVIGLGLAEALQHAVPDLPEHAYPRMSERYRHHYLAGDHTLRLFTGVEAMLADLRARGFAIAVATGKSRAGLARAMAHFDLGAFFHATRTADQCRSKPHPQMLEELMEELGSTPERTLMIGDTTHDLQMAKNAGVPGIGVSYGAHPEQELRALSPLACMPTVAALAEWLRQNA